jgi:nicotinamide-nucleotide amidase
VSEEVAREMVMHVKELFKSDYAISTTGIAGPAGATPQKQVGTVWIGIATPDGVITRKVLLGSNRLRIIEVTGITALNMLRKELLKRA